MSVTLLKRTILQISKLDPGNARQKWLYQYFKQVSIRGTTVYLADRRFDMLPSVLSERVCSLRHHVDRYSVSVIWTLDKHYNIVDTWFGRTIIHSSCEMEYEQAQQLLNGKQVATGLDASLCKKLKPRIEKLAEVLRVIRVRTEIFALWKPLIVFIAFIGQTFIQRCIRARRIRDKIQNHR